MKATQNYIIPTIHYNEANINILKYLRPRLSKKIIKILDAGCGERQSFPLYGINRIITGIDRSTKVVEGREDIDWFIKGDIRNKYLANKESFDVVYCIFVLEHIKGARLVLDNIIYWLKPGGYIILAIPDGGSAFGYISRHTTYYLHKIFFVILRLITRQNWGRRPYKAFYDKVVSKNEIINYCIANKLKIKRIYHLIQRMPIGAPLFYRIMYAMLNVFIYIVHLLSFRKLSLKHDLLFIINKQ